MIITVIFIVLTFLSTLYFYMFYYDTYNSVHKDIRTEKCPTLLIQKGDKIYLQNINEPEIPGVNPIIFDNLEDYVKVLEWQKSKGIECDVLFLKHEYDAQGNKVLKIRPDILEPSGGSQAKSSGNIDTIKDSPTKPLLQESSGLDIHDSKSKNVRIYDDSTKNYVGFDGDNQYIGIETPLDAISVDGPNVKEYDTDTTNDAKNITYNPNQIV